MKKCIVILIFSVIIQNSYCAENQSLDLGHIYYNDRYGLQNVFSNEHSVIRPDYRLSDVGFSKIRTKVIGHFLRNCFYTSQTPYVFLNKEDVVWYLQKYDNYISYDDEDYPCPIQKFKGVYFINLPHCKDLAFCIRHAADFEGRDKLLELLDASYDVQKLIQSDNETFSKMCHFVHFRTETIPLINKFLTKTFSQYTFQNYRSNIQEIFFKPFFLIPLL